MNVSVRMALKKNDAPYDEIEFDSVEQINELNHQYGWSVEYRKTDPGTFKGINRLRSLGCALLARERYNSNLDITSTPPSGKVAVVIGDEYHPALSVNGQEVSETSLMLIWPGSSTFTCFPGSGSMYVSHFEAADFLEKLDHRNPSLCSRISTSGAALYACRGDAVKSLRTYMGHALRSSGSGKAAENEICSILESIIFDTVETAYHHSELNVNIVGSRRHIAMIAREFIESRCLGAITMSDVHREVPASIRTIERAFLETFGMTVRDFIKICRLNAANKDLILSCSESTAVTEVAMHSGFMHLGRFSVEYKKLFGESPSESLRREKPFYG